MKTRLTWIIGLLLSHLLLFIAGSATGRYVTFNYVAGEAERADTRVNMGHYIAYRDIASDIKSGRYGSAKCNADLIASSLFDDARRCAASKDCWDLIEKEQRERVPEAVGKIPLPFDYIEPKNGIRRCAGDTAR